MVAAKTEDAKGQESGDNLRRLIRNPEPAQTGRELPAGIEVAEVQNVVGLNTGVSGHA